MSSKLVLFLGGGWIRLFQPLRAIAESWDEGDGKEWAKIKMAVDRRPGDLSAAVWECQSRRYAGGGSQATDGHLSRGAAQSPPHTWWPTSHQARANEGWTEEQGQAIQSIN